VYTTLLPVYIAVDLLTCLACVQIVLAVLAIIKLRKGVEDGTLSAVPAYNESHMSVPPAVTADYSDRDLQFAPHPFSTTISTAAIEPPAY